MSDLLEEVSTIRNNLGNLSPIMTERLYEILTHAPNRSVAAAVIQALYAAQIEYPDLHIIYYGSMLDAVTRAYPFAVPSMYILDIFSIKGVGVVVTGYLISGEFEISDKLQLLKADGRNIEVECTGVEESISKVSQVYLSCVTMAEISQGDYLVKYSL